MNVLDKSKDFGLATGLSLLAALVFYFTTKPTMEHFDYTVRVALALLRGHLGLDRHPGSWLSEMVPSEGKYYSVFPLGAVLSVVPVAFFQQAGWIHRFPAHFLTALIAGLCVFFFFRLSSVKIESISRRILLALFPVFGTWTWCNLGFAGAWQIALGFALLGEVGAMYFTLARPRPFIAGAFFALAFGNRTELVLILPIYLYLVFANPGDTETIGLHNVMRRLREKAPPLIYFLFVPATLAFLTAAYNFARFHSIFDFGYARIPRVLQEPWYQHGLFSLHAIPGNMYHMLFEGFGDTLPKFPYIQPYPFGCSIFLASPFLFLLFREGGKHKTACWIAIGALTLFLWCHGNAGGWQFSYRYGMVLLPWMFLLIVENGGRKIAKAEAALFLVSIAVNAVATYEFLWVKIIRV